MLPANLNVNVAEDKRGGLLVPEWTTNVSVNRTVWARPGGTILALATPAEGLNTIGTQHLGVGALVLESGIARFDRLGSGDNARPSLQCLIPVLRIPYGVQLVSAVGSAWPSETGSSSDTSPSRCAITGVEVDWTMPNRMLRLVVNVESQGANGDLSRIGYSVSAFFCGEDGFVVPDDILEEFLPGP